MPQSKDRANRPTNPEYPSCGAELRIGRRNPKERGKEKKKKQPEPFEPTPGLDVDVGIVAAGRAKPALPETQRQQRNPVNMAGVEGAQQNCPTR